MNLAVSLFVILAGIQVALAAVMSLFVLTVSEVWPVQGRRRHFLYAVIGGAIGGLVGVFAAYAVTVVAGLAWRALYLMHVVAARFAPLGGAFPTLHWIGYAAGVVGGVWWGWHLGGETVPRAGAGEQQVSGLLRQ